MLSGERRAGKRGGGNRQGVEPGEQAYQKSLRLLAVRGRSAKEMQERLEAAGFGAETAGQVLERLSSSGLLDDRRFAFDRARALGERGFGPRRIRFDLRRRGIEKLLIEEALEQAYGEEGRLGRLQRLLEHRFGEALAGSRDMKTKARAQRYLYSRGFEQDEIMALLHLEQPASR